MSDTRRYVQPGWGPSHPKWYGSEISPKEQARDHRGVSLKKTHRFSNYGRNTRYNLQRKNEALAEREEHELCD